MPSLADILFDEQDKPTRAAEILRDDAAKALRIAESAVPQERVGDDGKDKYSYQSPPEIVGPLAAVILQELRQSRYDARG